MLAFKATPVTMHETVLTFKHTNKNGITTEDSAEFHTGKLKPKNRGVSAVITRDPSLYIYEPINYVFEMYPVETQEKIFSIYKDLEENIKTNVEFIGIRKSMQNITDRINDLMNILTFDMLKTGVEKMESETRDDKRIYIPKLESDQYSRSVVKKAYNGLGLENEDWDIIEDSARYSEYKTEDYRELIVLSLAARALMPLFGTMIEHMDETVADKFKNSIVFRCIYSSWLQTSEPMKKYRHYLEYQVDQNNRSKDSAVLECVDDTQLPEYIAADTFVKKLGVFDLNKQDPNHNLIKAIYNYATNSVLGSLDKRFAGSVRKKISPSEKSTISGEEDRTGVLENNATRTDVPVGQRVTEDYLISETATKDLLSQIINMPIEEEHVKLAEEIFSILKTFEPDPYTQRFRDSVTRNLCERISPSTMYAYLEAKATYKLQATAITKLIIYGHYDVAALCMATTDEDSGGWLPQKLSLISKDRKDKIYELYKIWYPDTSANRNNSFFDNYYTNRSAAAVLSDKRGNNPGARQISTWVTKFIKNDYYNSFLPDVYLRQAEGAIDDNYNYQRPANINNILADLVIQILEENQIDTK